MNYFCAIYSYPADSEQIASIRPIHREFLSGLKDQGILVGSGPFLDSDGGALIVIRMPDSATVADAEALLDKDPFYTEKALDSRLIRQWNPVLNVFS